MDAAAQGKGLGSLLLIDALRRIRGAVESIGVHAFEVVAIDDTARSFYVEYGFVALADDPLHLYLTIKAVAKLDCD